MVTITENKPPEQVQITQSTAIRWPNEQQWPTSGEFRQLGILIKARYPGLTEGIDMGSDLKHGFLFLMYAGRRSTPDNGRSLSYWTQCANDWFEKYGIGGHTNPDALLASAICHGIPWSGPQYGKLAITLGESGEPLPSAFRKVLECGRVPDPFAATTVQDGSISIVRQRSI